MKYLVIFACLFLFFSWPIAAEEPFSLASELTKPGVKLVVIEFYASYCMPCRKAVPQWDILHQKYRAKGLRFVVVTLDEEGGCTDPGWSPDRVICDKDRYWQKRYGVEKLPQAFLYTWQGELISERSHVEQVEKAIERYFSEIQLRIGVDQVEVIGDKYAIGSNPDWVKDFVISEIRSNSKFDVVRSLSYPLGTDKEGECSVNFPPNSALRIKLFGDGRDNRHITLTLEKDGCVLALAKRPYKGKGLNEDKNSLVRAIKSAVMDLLRTVTRVKMPAAMMNRKIGSDDWFNEIKAVVVSFNPNPESVVMVDGKLVCPKTPCRKTIQPGPHVITISAENYLSQTETVTFASDRSIGWRLVPNFALLTVRSIPDSLPVTIDRQSVGDDTPIKKINLSPGRHVIEIGNDCYYKEQQTVTIERGEEKTIVFNPKPIKGGLEIKVRDNQGNIPNAKLSIAGKVIGKTPGRFNVSVCTKEIHILAHGYYKYKKKVTITDKKLTSIEVVLKEHKKVVKVAGASWIELIRIEPGTFIMGSPLSEEGHIYDEIQHQVTISKPFLISKYEVTQDQWLKVTGTYPSYHQKDCSIFRDGFCEMDYPVERVSWYDVVEFLNKVSKIEGLILCYTGSGSNISWVSGCNGYRLPTEAEWEYAARAGTTGIRYGDLDTIAWYRLNSNETQQLGGKQANPWGLHDMLGNVWELVWDWKADYPFGAVTDPTGPRSGIARVIRGGDYVNDATFCRSAYRASSLPSDRSLSTGFRLARSVDP